MYLRLAFAVAAPLEPDILVVDEILAVGDAEFQRKCLGRMEQAEQEGRTVLFVSHDLDTLTRLCRRAMWMEAGEVRCAGPSDGIVRDYLASGLVAERSGTSLIRSGPVAVHGVRVVPAEGEGPGLLMRGDSLRVEVEFELADEVPGMDLAIFVTTRTGVRVLDEVFSDRTEQRLGAGRYKAAMEVPPVLNVGDFSVGLWFGTAHTDILEEPVAASFTLHGSDRGRPDRVLVGDLPILVEQLQSVDGDS
jgi:energy-coupling factor transporter ATP-binding protein EcfA2